MKISIENEILKNILNIQGGVKFEPMGLQVN